MQHIRALADLADSLPPILVHQQTGQVIDGMHRLMAAQLRGQRAIKARLFSGDPAEAFVLAVKTNVTHGLPLSIADRKAAARRILGSHPHWSDRKIASVAGLSAKTVKAVRGRETSGNPLPGGRVGLDGRSRPLDSAARRAVATNLMREHPEYSLRRVAKHAGISPETARSIRVEMANEMAGPDRDAPQPLVPGTPVKAHDANQPSDDDVHRSYQALIDDPALRSREVGRLLLRTLSTYRVIDPRVDELVQAIPDHDLAIVQKVASANADAWQRLIETLARRSRRRSR